MSAWICRPYSAQSLRTPNALDALVTREQFMQFGVCHYVEFIGVASYGALGRVPPRLPTIYFFYHTGSRVVSVHDSGAEGPGFKSQS